MISVVTPMVAPEGNQASATSQQAFGCIGMSTSPDAHFLAITLAHETQHAKLGALADVVPLTLPDIGHRFYAPWRDDPRPASGLLHGVYAHLGIAGYWRRQRCHEFGEVGFRAHREFARWRDAAALGAQTIAESGQLTPAGQSFVAGITNTLEAWRRESVPPEAAAHSREAANQHLTNWRRRNGTPPLPAGQDVF